MLSKIKVYGRLARFLGQNTFEAEINSTVDAIRFLTANFPNLQSHMIEQNYCIKVGEYEINEKELDVPVGQQEIKIVPVAVGARRGLGRFLLGAVLIGVAVFNPAVGMGLGGGLGFGTAAGAGFGATLAAAAGNLGVYLALSGVAEMLSPVQTDTTTDDPNSFNFNGILNTVNAGSAIPVVYGEVFTGSIIVSAGIDTEDFSGGT
jgi:predicted phage tail protein